MAASGGRTPWDATQASVGPARVVYTDDTSVAVPVDAWDIVAPVANGSGEYPLQTGWKDFGLAADAPSYTHSKDSAGLEYEQPVQALFEQITSITRKFVAQVAEISPENMKIVENTSSAIETIAAATGASAQKKVPFGLYPGLKRRRIAMISYRPEGSAIVTEGAGGPTRPPAIVLVLPQVALSTEDSEFSFKKGEPTNGAISFTCFPEDTLDAGEEHGFWIFEQAGVIAIV